MSQEVTHNNGADKHPNYWKSLNELAKNKEYEKFVEREFPENATELTNRFSRRRFLRVMGASIALAGFAACRRPGQKILPFSRQPEHVNRAITLHPCPFRMRSRALSLKTTKDARPRLRVMICTPQAEGHQVSFHRDLC